MLIIYKQAICYSQIINRQSKQSGNNSEIFNSLMFTFAGGYKVRYWLELRKRINLPAGKNLMQEVFAKM